MQKSLKKEVNEKSYRNQTQEEIEKYEVVKLDRAEDNFLSVISVKKFEDKKSTSKFTQKYNIGRNGKFKLLN